MRRRFDRKTMQLQCVGRMNGDQRGNYNERPAWLDNAHRDLDAAVAAAYGWPADISEEDALARLLALNLDRSAAGR
jgi:hypothetical protein